MRKRIDYPVGEKGHTLGETHHSAKLTDAQVEEIRDLHDAGQGGYRKLARQFNVSRSMIRMIVTFQRRATTPAGYRSRWVEVPGADFAVRPDWFQAKAPPGFFDKPVHTKGDLAE